MLTEDSEPNGREDAENDLGESLPDIPIIEIPMEMPVESEVDVQKQLDEAEKRALRYQADLDNYRRRVARDSEDRLKYATLPLLTSLLDVVDNLDRALQSASTDNDGESLRAGVEMVAQQLATTLDSANVKRIESVGLPFDPNLHEAIQMQSSDTVPQNSITMEVQAGYRLHERVIRPAKVMISTGPAVDA